MAVRITDGSCDFALGVDSGRTPTIESSLNEHGLKRSQTAWMTNCTCRGGGISPRSGWKFLVRITPPGSGVFQGAFIYDAGTQDDSKLPYLMVSIGGKLFQVRVDTNNTVVNLSAMFGLYDPVDVKQSFFVQGEEFMVKQIGNYFTLPLIWDGYTLRRSHGL